MTGNASGECAATWHECPQEAFSVIVTNRHIHSAVWQEPISPSGEIGRTSWREGSRTEWRWMC